MTDRPILFSAPMVRALIAGRKTQTRRIFKGIEETADGKFHLFNAGGGLLGVTEKDVAECGPDYVRVQAGDRLYVREHWRTTYDIDWTVEALGRPLNPREFTPRDTPVEYLADGENELGGKDRRAMHMPRWASRLTLIVTDVKIERLQDISDKGPQNDCTAEGVYHCDMRVPSYEEWRDAGFHSAEKHMYRTLWESINGDGSWSENPWVVAYTFTVQHGNIDLIDREAA